MKKRIVSMLLALTLAVSGMPVGMTAEGVNAAEVSESEVFGETEETEDAVENKDTYKKELYSGASDLCIFHVSADGKAVGSDGVVYDDVVYLSADTVEALDVEGQNAYIEICDRIAEEKKVGAYIENAVIAVDENGNLFFQREIPVNALQNTMEKLAGDFSEDIEVFGNDDTQDDDIQLVEEIEEISTDKNVEAEIAVEDKSEKDDLKDADSDDEIVVNETDAENVAEEVSKVEMSADEVVSVDDEELSTEKDLTEGDLTEEDSVLESAADEVAVAEESESVAEVFVFNAENMDLIGGYETEQFEIVENPKADIVIDLGYDNAGDVLQFNSILPKSDWFSSQLSKSQESIYNACKVMGKGTNTFTITPSSIPSDVDICQAISAYIMTEPYKCDWMDLTKAPSIIDYYLVDPNGKKIYNKKTTITIAKSKYCTSAIQKQANAKVLELAAEAQNYAEQNRPDSPVYGVVEYFDKWICENNEYDYRGVLGGDSADKAIQEAYYYCHSSYGILLKGYGVCESYALTMTRLLDAVGIPNMYATGIGNNGGHAWNYVGMPDGKWYLQDSTWNDVGAYSDKTYLLCADDANLDTGHKPQGNRYVLKSGDFKFVDRASSNYDRKNATDKIILSLKNDTKSEPVTELNLLAKKSAELTFENGQNTYISNENIPKVWSSSDEKIVKVDKNGKVTAVAPGSAEITLTAAGITAKCTVNVHQINSVTFDEGGKASLTTSCGIVSGSTKETQHISLTVNQNAKEPVYTAEQLNDKGVFDDFEAKPVDDTVVTVSKTLTGDKIDLAITPKKEGKTKINVTFGTKKAILTVSVGKMLNESWFELKEVKDLQAAGEDGTLVYTGKAYKPKVELSEAGKTEKVKFKVSYLNNKDAGTASIIIVGNGNHGGALRYDFTINPLVLNVDTASIKVTEKNVYNGGINLTKSTVKHIDNSGKKPKLVSLKAGRDYDILYTKGAVTTTSPTEVGTYTTMKIVGKGNYAGKVNGSIPTQEITGKTWTIDPIDIKKAKVTVKVNGRKPDVMVAIGKNVLSEKTNTKDGDYKLTFYKDKDCKEQVNVFAAKTQYYVKIEGGVGPNLTNANPIVKNFKTK